MQILFMVLLGGYPKGRLIEQHDVYFGIGENVRDLVPHIINSWPEANGNIHVDAWRAINYVGGYSVQIIEKNDKHVQKENDKHLFFLNLGGYKPCEFEEYHYKLIVVATNKSDAVKQAKKTVFFKHNGFKGAPAHVDEKYGIDVDDVYGVLDILPSSFKDIYTIQLTIAAQPIEDELQVGYFKLNKL